MLNKVSYKILKVPELKLFCKHVKLKINKNKLELFQSYCRYLAVKVIQRYYRKHFYKNAECSITLEKVSYPCFVYRNKFGKLFFYDYISIVKYICKTGNTNDPMTREPYSDTVLNNLDLSIKKHYSKKYSSTLKIKRNMDYARKVRNLENDIITYQTLLEENKVLILNLIDSGLLKIPGSIYINNENFNNPDDYLLFLLEKVGNVYENLKTLDSFWATAFKNDFLEKLNNYNQNDVKNIIEFVNLI